jgi:hypothetical protein
MGIEWFRDLVICIFGVIAIGVLIWIAILSYLLYQRSKPLMEVMHTVYQRADSILDAKAMLNPITQIIATIQGIRQGINAINKIFKKKEEEKEK